MSTVEVRGDNKKDIMLKSSENNIKYLELTQLKIFSYSIISINKSKGSSKLLLKHNFHYIYKTII